MSVRPGERFFPPTMSDFADVTEKAGRGVEPSTPNTVKEVIIISNTLDWTQATHP